MVKVRSETHKDFYFTSLTEYLESLVTAIGEEKEIKDIQISQIVSFYDSKHRKNKYVKLLEMISKFGKVAAYKISLNNQEYFCISVTNLMKNKFYKQLHCHLFINEILSFTGEWI